MFEWECHESEIVGASSRGSLNVSKQSARPVCRMRCVFWMLLGGTCDTILFFRSMSLDTCPMGFVVDVSRGEPMLVGGCFMQMITFDTLTQRKTR